MVVALVDVISHITVADHLKKHNMQVRQNANKIKYCKFYTQQRLSALWTVMAEKHTYTFYTGWSNPQGSNLRQIKKTVLCVYE